MTEAGRRGAQHQRESKKTVSIRDLALKRVLESVQTAGIITAPAAILRAAEKAGHPSEISSGGLAQFIEKDERSMDAHLREPLERFLYETALGRALRSPSPNGTSAFDRLTAELGTGNLLKPPDLEVAGMYFLYHGSYMRPRHFVVRLLEIRCVHGTILVVTDKLRDNIAKPPFPVLEAHGCLTFEGNRPHIVLRAKDNRAGFGLMVASKISVGKNELKNFIGKVFGTTAEGKPFERHCIAIKANKTDSDAVRKKLIQETGLYTLAKLKRRHRSAIDLLAETMPEPLFYDPILNHPDLIIRIPNEPSQ
jgi:hypothetical protein